MSWATLSIDEVVFQGREAAHVDVSTERLDAAKERFIALARPRLNSLIDSQGVTETVFLDKLADMATTSDVRTALQWSLGTAYLHTFYRADYAVAGGADYERAEQYRLDLMGELAGFRGLVERAIKAKEITFTAGTEITRTRLADRAVYTI